MFKFCVVLALLVAVALANPVPEPKAKPQFLTTAYSAPLLANPAALTYSAPLAAYSANYITPSIYSAGYSAYSPYAAAGTSLIYV